MDNLKDTYEYYYEEHDEYLDYLDEYYSKYLSEGHFVIIDSFLIGVEDFKGNAVIPDGITCISDDAFYGSLNTSIVIPQTVKYLGEKVLYDCKKLKKLTIPYGIKFGGNNPGECLQYKDSKSDSIKSIKCSITVYKNDITVTIPYFDKWTNADQEKTLKCLSEDEPSIRRTLFNEISNIQLKSILAVILTVFSDDKEYQSYLKKNLLAAKEILTKNKNQKALEKLELMGFKCDSPKASKTMDKKSKSNKHRFALVKLSPRGKTYEYILEIDDVAVGDTICVKSMNGISEVTVLDIVEKYDDELPLPLSRYKKVISKLQETKEEKIRFASVRFDSGDKQYEYMLNIEGISVGDKVYVKTFRGATEVTVVRIYERNKSDLRADISDYGLILGKGTASYYNKLLDEGKIAYHMEKVPIEPIFDISDEGVLKSVTFGEKTENVVVPEGVTRIEPKVFFKCDFIRFVQLPSTLQIIGRGAFANCSKLEEIVIPDNVTSISPEAFKNTGLVSVILSKSLKTIATQTFMGCKKLNMVEIPSNIKIIKPEAFGGCYALKNVILNEGLKKIERLAFYDSGVGEITIPKSVDDIGSQALGYVKPEAGEIVARIRLKIHCYEGSAAEMYAKSHEFKYINI